MSRHGTIAKSPAAGQQGDREGEVMRSAAAGAERGEEGEDVVEVECPLRRRQV